MTTKTTANSAELAQDRVAIEIHALLIDIAEVLDQWTREPSTLPKVDSLNYVREQLRRAADHLGVPQ